MDVEESMIKGIITSFYNRSVGIDGKTHKTSSAMMWLQIGDEVEFTVENGIIVSGNRTSKRKLETDEEFKKSLKTPSYA